METQKSNLKRGVNYVNSVVIKTKFLAEPLKDHN